MSWRKIDIDQYDEDAYTEDEILAEFETGLTPEQVHSATQTRSTDVRNLLTKGDLNTALTRALEEPPYGRHLDAAKSESTKTVTEVLNLFRASDIAQMVGSLSREQQDLTEVAGTGCIVRVMTDKRTVF
ncbi:actin-related protein 2/3 complex subunit 5 [Gilbertella persicaria]|uniref:actin-related protein 2/3 complex subunit 5 n=1 Tax=Gilbertella persicaria TaxID=101096 RepID=UPI00221EE77F|nr:actin-related protein 2/3 complex subunit 5 [Gilbertella persicaria]KAI8092339.1 actin-related protein 2/3 complex subunit 5 [Gilbertella persicaria]